MQTGSLCNGCQRPTAVCSCARHAPPPSGFWQQSLSIQTPRRPGPVLSSGPHQQPTPHQYPPTVPFFPYYSAQMYDPRFAFPPHRPTTLIPQPTPIRQATHNTFGSRAPLSPIQHSPAPVNARKRKRTEGGSRAPAKRAKQTQPIDSHTQDENSPVMVPGVGPSTADRSCIPASCPKPIADYSPISKPRRSLESKQAASDVWYFVRPLETRDRPSGPIQDPPPGHTKPKSRFVGCRLCPM